jgi:hypothetical protein
MLRHHTVSSRQEINHPLQLTVVRHKQRNLDIEIRARGCGLNASIESLGGLLGPPQGVQQLGAQQVVIPIAGFRRGGVEYRQGKFQARVMEHREN